MANPYIDARKKAIGRRIADLVFLLNKLEELEEMMRIINE